MGCSFGGRQALTAAARWPADWDGIIAGAPAADWPTRLAGFARIQHALRGVPGGWIAPDRIADLVATARRLCRAGQSGCAIDFLRRACRSGKPAACLTTPQEASLRTIEAAGYPLVDADPAEWQRWIVNPDPEAPSQLTFAMQAYRWLFGVSRNWTPADDVALTPDRSRTLTFSVGSLRPFLAKGGKVISYFGTADAVLPPAFAAADARARGAAMPAYRLFLVPGMAHCQGGSAPHAFGQSLSAPAPADDPRSDIRRMLEAWVERGVTPRLLVAATVGPGPRGTVTLWPVDLAAVPR
jgi:feruloyl esterase